MNRDELAEHIEGFMTKVPGEDDRPWDSVSMAKFLLPEIEVEIKVERSRCLEIWRRYHNELAPVEIGKMIENGHIPAGFKSK